MWAQEPKYYIHSNVHSFVLMKYVSQYGECKIKMET